MLAKGWQRGGHAAVQPLLLRRCRKLSIIRAKYMDTPFLQAAYQIVLGGAIVLGVGILIGAA